MGKLVVLFYVFFLNCRKQWRVRMFVVVLCLFFLNCTRWWQAFQLIIVVATLALGSRPRQRGCKVAGQQEEAQESRQRQCKGAGQEEARESHQILPGVQGSVRECEGVNTHTPKAAPTLREGVPLDSRNWLPKLSPGGLPKWSPDGLPKWSPSGLPKLQRPIWGVKSQMACGALYINGKLLKRRCLKWARIAHLDIWNTSYDQNKGRESNSRESTNFDSRPLKVRNRPEILGCKRRAPYRWKALDESYNFASDRTSIRGLLAKLWGFKVPGVP